MERRLFGTRKASWRTHLIGAAALLLGLSLVLSACSAQSAPTKQAQVSAATPTQANPTATPAPPTSTSVPPPATPVPPTPISAPTDTPAPPTPEPAAEDGASYSTEIQPIFDERCIQCHSGDSAPRGLSLDSYENTLAGGTYRPVVTPGLAEESELVKRIKGEAIPRMPFDGPPFLSDEQIALIVDWIEMGAPNN